MSDRIRLGSVYDQQESFFRLDNMQFNVLLDSGIFLVDLFVGNEFLIFVILSDINLKVNVGVYISDICCV